MLAEFNKTTKLAAVFAQHGSVKVLALLIVNECFDGLAERGGAVGLYRFSDCIVGEFYFTFDPLGIGRRFLLGGTTLLSPAVRPAEMFPAVAALIKLFSGVLAIEGVADKDRDDGCAHGVLRRPGTWRTPS